MNLPSASVEALITSCDPSVPLGARDRAILLLIARHGLRASDVISLQICQLLWSKGTVRVAGRNRLEVELPLAQEVGDASRASMFAEIAILRCAGLRTEAAVPMDGFR